MSTLIPRRKAISTLLAGSVAITSTPARLSSQDVAEVATTEPRPPDYVYLTWQNDPCTTITVNFQSLDPRKLDGRVRYWRDKSTHPRSELYPVNPVEVSTRQHRIKNLPDGRWVHHVELTNLLPGATYSLQVRVKGSDWTSAYRFRPLPNDDTPLRFVFGGDIGARTAHQKNPGERDPLHALAALKDPHFALLGGDLAYADGNVDKVAAWDSLFTAWKQHFIAPGRRLIPLILAIGNHEVQGGYEGTPGKAPFYYGFFAQAGDQAHFMRRLGPRLALVVLDSGHTASHASQTSWLDKQLTSLQDTPHVMAMYHVPLYPSIRPYNGKHSENGRKEWLPVFDKHGVEVAFENHDHALKRTHPLRNGHIVSPGRGTVYLGDGAFGIGARPQPADADARGYLSRAGSMQHFWLVEEKGPILAYQAIDSIGRIVDSYPISSQEADENFHRLAAEANAFAQIEEEAKQKARDVGIEW